MAKPEFEDFFRATLNKVNTAFNMPIPEHELEQQWNSQADAFNQWTSLSLGEQLAWAQARAVAVDRAQRGDAPAPLEPRGCPTPGACSCPTAPIVPPDLIRALELAEAALADIGDADREQGDDLAWAEARAAQDLPRIRQALILWRNQALVSVWLSVTQVAVEALQRLRRWGGLTGSTGYSADVVLGVVDWIDGGMTGPLPPMPYYIAARATTTQEPQL
jgi:hypothetical protein